MLLDDLQKGYYNPLKSCQAIINRRLVSIISELRQELFKRGFNLFCEPLVSDESVASFRFYKHKNYTNMI